MAAVYIVNHPPPGLLDISFPNERSTQLLNYNATNMLDDTITQYKEMSKITRFRIQTPQHLC